MTNTKEISSHCVVVRVSLSLCCCLDGCVRLSIYFCPIILSSIFNLNTRKNSFFWTRLHIVRRTFKLCCCYACVRVCVWSDFGIFPSSLFVGIVVIPTKKCSTRMQFNWMARVENELTAQRMTSIWNERKGKRAAAERGATISGSMMHF